MEIDELYNELRVFESEIDAKKPKTTSTQNVSSGSNGSSTDTGFVAGANGASNGKPKNLFYSIE